MGLFSSIFSKKPAKGIGGTAIGKTKVAGRSYTVHRGGVMVADPIPVQKRIKGMKPGVSGLYPHEVLMLSYVEEYPLKGAKYQGFWWYRYGVKDAGKLVSDLQKRGYVTAGGMEQSLANAKVADLKDACKVLGLKSSGKKAELIARLIEHGDELERRGLFQEKYYALTEVGAQALEREPYVPWAHAHGHPEEGVDIWTIGAKVGKGGNRHWRDYQWGQLNRQYIEHSKAGDFGLARNTRLSMCEFLEEEGRTKDALAAAVDVEYMDVNGVANGITLASLDRLAGKILRPYDKSSLRSAPGIIKKIKKFAKELDFSDVELHSFVLEEAKRLSGKTLVVFFAPEEVAQIVALEISGNTDELSMMYEFAKERHLSRSE